MSPSETSAISLKKEDRRGFRRYFVDKINKTVRAGRLWFGVDRDRTDDLLLAKQMLFQLSYDPIYKILVFRSVLKNNKLHLNKKADDRKCLK